MLDSGPDDDDASHGVELGANILMDLVSAGVLRIWENEFDELVVSLNYEAVHWRAAAALADGVTRFCREDRLGRAAEALEVGAHDGFNSLGLDYTAAEGSRSLLCRRT